MQNFLIGAATAAIIFVIAIGSVMMAFPLQPAPAAATYAASPTSAAIDREESQAPRPPIFLSIRVAAVKRNLPPYNRKDWQPDGWEDADGDCQDTRQEILIAEALGAVFYSDERECEVASGVWLDAYTGELFDKPRDMDIDHLVPLGNAHISGGAAWSAERKIQYANYLDRGNHLIAVSASANRSKGDRGPEEWRPPRAEYHCRYAASWVGIKRRWGLTATRREFNELRDMLANCRAPITLIREKSDAQG